MPLISYIISAYDRPVDLNLCLLSLRLQTHQDFDVIVVDNGNDEMYEANQMSIKRAGLAQAVFHYHTHESYCYPSTDFGASLSNAEWLAFPSDDGYYAPVFAEKMLAAGRENNWDLVYCDAMFRRSKTDQLYDGKYQTLITELRAGQFDKTIFIVRRSIFKGFRAHERVFPIGADSYLIEQYVRDGVPMGKVSELLVVHG
jgi:glycosyltransferase involved in cell wall biosynthesis